MRRYFGRIALGFSLMVAVCGLPASSSSQVLDLSGHAAEPVSDKPGNISVLFFVREDCPISSRYAPEIQRLSTKFAGSRVQFWLVFPVRNETPQAIGKYLRDYGYHIAALRDPSHTLVKRSQAEITPEAAVFLAGRLVYHGRVDDRFVTFGKTRPEPTVHDLEDALAAVLDGKPVHNPHVQGIGCYISDLE